VAFVLGYLYIFIIMKNENGENNPQWEKIPRYKSCFVCGPDNDYGLQLAFEARGNEVRTKWVPKEIHCGYVRTVHGGIIAAVLDEIMGWTGWLRYRKYYFTAEVTIRYKKPIISNEKYEVVAKLTNAARKLYTAEASIIDDAGEVAAKATGKYIVREDIEPSDYY